jgi:PAS domain S-box-containing protein
MSGDEWVYLTEDNEREHSLADATRRLEAVLDNATVAIFLMDDSQHCIYMNCAAERLTGFALSEVLSLDVPLHDIIHHTYPDGSAFPLHECAIDRAFPEHNQTRGEEVFVHKDGRFYPVAFCASPINDENSKTVGTIIEVRDITQEKLADEQRRLLTNELNHRVKNTLATVQALARQTFHGECEEALATFQGRLNALSKAHNVLTSTFWQHASFDDIVEGVIAPFGRERFEVSGESFDVHPKAAVSLAMVLHELATNAAKYGALSVAHGTVSLDWSAKQHSDRTELDLVWKEAGGPEIVSQPSVFGFGTQLIEQQLAYEFDGATHLDFLRSGLVCRIRLSIPHNQGPIAP